MLERWIIIISGAAFSPFLYVTHHFKSRQKSKLVLFSHEILCCKTFQMTYYLFIYDVPNRSCVTLKYSSVGNYFWRKTQSKFDKYASLATHNYSKTTRMSIFVYQSFCWLRYEDQTLAFLSIYNIHAVYSKCYPLKSSQDHVCCAIVLRNAH